MDIQDLIAPALAEAYAEQGRFVTKALLIIETDVLDEEKAAAAGTPRGRALHLRGNSELMVWDTAGMLQWATITTADDLSELSHVVAHDEDDEP